MSTKSLAVIVGTVMVVFFTSSTLHPVIADPQSGGKEQHHKGGKDHHKGGKDHHKGGEHHKGEKH